MGQCCGSKDLPDPYNLSGSVLRDRGLDPNSTKKGTKSSENICNKSVFFLMLNQGFLGSDCIYLGLVTFCLVV